MDSLARDRMAEHFDEFLGDREGDGVLRANQADIGKGISGAIEQPSTPCWAVAGRTDIHMWHVETDGRTDLAGGLRNAMRNNHDTWHF